jgi:CBS domain-containing protein
MGSAEATAHREVSMSPRVIEVLDRLYRGEEIFFRYIRTVGDLMTVEPVAIAMEGTLADARELQSEHGVHHLPVLQMGELAGVLTARDVSAVLSSGVGTLAQSSLDDEALQAPVMSAVNRKPPIVLGSASLTSAMTRMLDTGLSGLMVVDSAEPPWTLVGVLTETDLCRCFLRFEVLRRSRAVGDHPSTSLVDFVRAGARGATPTDLLVNSLLGSVEQVMRAGAPLSVGPDATLGEAAALMHEHRIRHLIVTDADHKLQGILSDRDLLAALPRPEGNRHSEGAAATLKRQIRLPGPGLTKALRRRVHNSMSTEPRCVAVGASLFDAVEILLQSEYGILPVVRVQGGPVVGILSRRDLLAAMLAMGRIALSSDETGVGDVVRRSDGIS